MALLSHPARADRVRTLRGPARCPISYLTGGRCCCPATGCGPWRLTLAERAASRRSIAPGPGGGRLGCNSTPPACWCCRGSSTSTATRSNARCSRGRASISRCASRSKIPSAQLLANGITTAFHRRHPVVGTRAAQPRDLAHAARPRWRRERWICDMRVHLRWEAYNLDALETALADIAAGRVHLLAFNDHTPAILKKMGDPVDGGEIHRAAPGMHPGRIPGAGEPVGDARGGDSGGPARLARPRRGRRACRSPAMTMRRWTTASASATSARASASSRWPRRWARRRARPAMRSSMGSPNVRAREVASRLGLGGAAGRGGYLLGADVGLFLPRAAACGAGPGRARRCSTWNGPGG